MARPRLDEQESARRERSACGSQQPRRPAAPAVRRRCSSNSAVAQCRLAPLCRHHLRTDRV